MKILLHRFKTFHLNEQGATLVESVAWTAAIAVMLWAIYAVLLAGAPQMVGAWTNAGINQRDLWEGRGNMPSGWVNPQPIPDATYSSNSAALNVKGTQDQSWWGQAWGWLKGLGTGLVNGVGSLSRRFIDRDGQIKFGPADPGSTWKVDRWFHIDLPDSGTPFTHLNADSGLLNWLGLNHAEVPSWLRWLDNAGFLKGLGDALIIVGILMSLYDVWNTWRTGGDPWRAVAKEVGGWVGAIAGAAGGAFLGGGTPLSLVLAIGGGTGGAIAGEWAGEHLYDWLSGIMRRQPAIQPENP